MRLNKVSYLIKEGFKSIFTHGFMSFASVTIIVACLLIMGSFALLAVNIDAIIGDLEAENQMLAYVDETLSDEDALALEAKLESIGNISDAQFVSRDIAMDEFTAQYNDSSIFEGVESTVFRHRYIIYLDDISLMAETRDKIENVTGIADVNAYLKVAEGFVRVRNVVTAISMVMVVILVIVSVFIMSNTIKLTTFGRREEIAIMKMVGASNGFIRTPFVVEGLVLGILGSSIAFGLQWGIYELVTQQVMSGLVGNLVDIVPFTSLLWPVVVVFVGIGFLVGAFGGIIAIRNYLKV